MSTPSNTPLRVWINRQEHQLPTGATLLDAVALTQPPRPFAAAVNLRFVPARLHGETALADGDQVELISPITGG